MEGSAVRPVTKIHTKSGPDYSDNATTYYQTNNRKRIYDNVKKPAI